MAIAFRLLSWTSYHSIGNSLSKCKVIIFLLEFLTNCGRSSRDVGLHLKSVLPWTGLKTSWRLLCSDYSCICSEDDFVRKVAFAYNASMMPYFLRSTPTNRIIQSEVRVVVVYDSIVHCTTDNNIDHPILNGGLVHDVWVSGLKVEVSKIYPHISIIYEIARYLYTPDERS